jgi:hypothetical protein
MTRLPVTAAIPRGAQLEGTQVRVGPHPSALARPDRRELYRTLVPEMDVGRSRDPHL